VFLKTKRIFILWSSVFLPATFGQAEVPVVTPAQILEALQAGGNYACDVLLDENGKSRCDYQMIEGKWYDYEPAWHTGQIIYGLLEAYAITGNPKFLENAKRAGDWWISLEIKDHPQLKGMLRAIHGDYIENYIVFATISDGTAGLFRLWEVTREKKYGQIPTQAGDWMLRNMWNADARVFYDNVDPETGAVLTEYSPFWKGKEKHELYDVSRPNNEGSLFKDMFEFTGDEKYKKIFIEICESLVEKQGEAGVWLDFMPNEKETGVFHPRFSLWYAESLLEGYALTGDKRFLEAALKTARVFTRFQNGEGTIFYKNYLSGKINQNSICGSAVAFAGIIWLRLHQAGFTEFSENIEKSALWVVTNRYPANHPDSNLAGGFLETRMRNRQHRIWLTHRDIATSFGLRFLADYYRFKFSEPAKPTR
jgi:uncharacterized protein YyaL (SSP411 family)